MLSRDDIIRMAREAHRRLVTEDYPGHTGQLDPWTMTLLARFAALVAAAEREVCAKVCEDDPSRAWDWLGEIRPGGHYAAAIRAQAADRLARHGIQIPEDDHDGNPSF
jgi:hypothetical protein